MPNTVARARTGKQSGGTAPAVRPNVAIVRSAYNAPGTPGFERAYSYRQEFSILPIITDENDNAENISCNHNYFSP